MSIKVTDHDLSPIIAGARLWIDRCLVEDASLLANSRGLWSTANADRLQSGFVERPDSGGDDFMTKLEWQLSDTGAPALPTFGKRGGLMGRLVRSLANPGW
ncbi:MAG TPA: hypothetical protein VGI48_14520 [Caldimonas sp.]|jgi:hypothetical protein